LPESVKNQRRFLLDALNLEFLRRFPTLNQFDKLAFEWNQSCRTVLGTLAIEAPVRWC